MTQKSTEVVGACQKPMVMETFDRDLTEHRDPSIEYEVKLIEFNKIRGILANIIHSVADPKNNTKLNLIRNKLVNLREEVYGLCMKRHYHFIKSLKEIY